MIHSDRLNKTEEMLLFLMGCIEQHCEDRFIASLYTRNYDVGDVRALTDDVRACIHIAHGELLRLSKYSIEYNRLFAVRDNKRFTTAEKMFNRMRSSMASIKRSYRSSTPINHHPTNNPLIKPSVFLRSVLTYGDCPLDLFKLTAYGDEVQTLYIEQRALFAIILANIQLCYQVIQKEKEIGNDAEMCERLFENQVNGFAEDLMKMVNNIKTSDGGVIRKRINEIGKKSFAQEGWHKYTPDDVREYVCYLLSHNLIGNKATKVSIIWPGNPHKEDDARLIAQHIDEILPDHKKITSGKKTLLYMLWCGSTLENLNKKHYDFLKENAFEQKPLTEWHNINTTKSRVDEKFKEEQKTFNDAVDKFLSEHQQFNQQAS